ncbi:uncharacterized protein BT62DRAFT_1079189 [Guyanagaster necrorhizus]|uniref:Uncharacterized protein n=1 Tax=Guyanagaster necrorhizus TaxID=856835 RepID=A0A9P7VK43_9AGAR|nr:uncharacterized protein BT62DRAFT_1079189 [Guyanagaster necrorhizus MCA 3950]KAG7442588.1 hypothetical protein BT62DRAFT_1079189 [Guyanagaster necrorhizus MCA 3950]
MLSNTPRLRGKPPTAWTSGCLQSCWACSTEMHTPPDVIRSRERRHPQPGTRPRTISGNDQKQGGRTLCLVYHI